jgi:diguanylate cyclase (GGDEF)-like protein
MLRAECRHSDIVGRVGGEEFTLLAPETSRDAAEAIAERIIAGCRRLVVDSPTGDVRCTCSIGISEVESGDQNIDAVLRRADRCAADAKRSGRDCWKTHSPDTEPVLANA